MDQEQQQIPPAGDAGTAPSHGEAVGGQEWPQAACPAETSATHAAAAEQAPATSGYGSGAWNQQAPVQPAAQQASVQQAPTQQAAAPQQGAPFAPYASGGAPLPPAPARSENRLANMFGWLAASVVPALTVIACEFGSVLLFSAIFAVFGLVLPLRLIDYDTTEPLLMVGMQLCSLAVLLPWWDHIYQRSFLRVRRSETPVRSRPVKIFQRVVGIVFMGLALQVVLSALVSLVLQFFPAVDQEYSALMEEPAGGFALALSVLSAVVGAPLMEEITVRGLVFEFALRACNFARRGQWRLPRSGSSFSAGKEARERDLLTLSRAAASTDTMPPAAFWCANVVQATIFAVMHMNITQGVYTYFMGLIFGWVAWRTGKLRYSILLHFTLNASSYLLDSLTFSSDLGFVMLSLVMVLVGLAGFALFESGCAEDSERDAASVAVSLAVKYAEPVAAAAAPTMSAPAVSASAASAPAVSAPVVGEASPAASAATVPVMSSPAAPASMLSSPVSASAPAPAPVAGAPAASASVPAPDAGETPVSADTSAPAQSGGETTAQ